MRSSRRYALSAALILAGGLCVAAPLIMEALEYPWGPADETALPDPSPPDFAYIDYTEYADAFPETEDPPKSAASPEQTGQPDGVGEQLVLPDYDDPPEEAPPEDAAPTGAVNPNPGQGAVPSPPKYVLLGAIKIPRLNLSENLLEGTDKQLKHGVGHLEGTPMPGKKGNAVLAAHRVSSSGKHPFRHLDKMQEGDVVAVKLGDETFRYEVFDVFIISETDLWVLQPAADEPYLLTLVTCDPVVSVGRRENRLIVRARLVE